MTKLTNFFCIFSVAEPSIMVTPPMAQATTGSNVIFMCEILFEGGVRGPYQIAWYNATGGELFI